MNSGVILVRGQQLTFRGKCYRCATGKGGFSSQKREGDGCTPLGTFALRECWYRADRVPRPITALPLRVIGKVDGWSDDPTSPEYNTHVTLPYQPSHEKLWRDDHVYDIIVPIGYNDDPIMVGRGSAIFMHLAHDDYKPTEGCVALLASDLLEILSHLSQETRIDIAAA